MSKYQEALNNIIEYVKEEVLVDYIEEFNHLQELVYRITPMKPLNQSWHKMSNYGYMSGECPVCKKRIEQNEMFCHNCGQALDWSEKYE
jgi:hypothetical protein